MHFIKKAMLNSKLTTQGKTPTGIVELLDSEMSSYEPGRGYANLHASDLTKKDFCARKAALCVTHKKQANESIGCALQATFDLGRATEGLVREEWLRDFSYGGWQCYLCGYEEVGPWPKDKLCKCGASYHAVKYQELKVRDITSGASGSVDLFLKLRGKLRLVELKIMAADEWDKLIAPLAEHRERTNYYLELWADNGIPKLDGQLLCDKSSFIILYVSRGFGRKHPVLNKVLPFKEFVFQHDPALTPPIHAKAQSAKVWYMDHQMPERTLCATKADGIKRKCPVTRECFGE